MNTDLQKFEAIKDLIQRGASNDEWQKAGLLEAISQVIHNNEQDLSSEGINNLIHKAADY